MATYPLNMGVNAYQALPGHMVRNAQSYALTPWR